MDKEKIVSTLTNIAYGVAGLAQYLVSALLLPTSIYLGVLMLGSGYHHYHLESWSRKWDYLAMYATLSSSICFGLLGASWETWIIPFTLSVSLYLVFGNSQTVIAGLIGSLLTVVWLVTHPVYAIVLASFAALPFTFNMLGDSLLKNKRDPVHGIGWHVPTAGVLMVTNILLLFARFNLLPLV